MSTIREQIVSETLFKTLKERQLRLDSLKKSKLLWKEFLREQILTYERIDLLMVHVLGYDITDFHQAMYNGLSQNSLVIQNTEGKRQTWNLTLAPRGFGKSTCLNVARSILRILKNPNIRILVASKTETNAVSFLSEIKQKLQRKELVSIFGKQQGFPWNDGSIRVTNRTSDAKEDTVETIGIGGAIASKHYDLIIADDLIDESNSVTEIQRQKILTWFLKVLDPCLEPHGEMSVIGTRYNPEDLYGYLIENVLTIKDCNPPKKHYQIFPALIPNKKLGAFGLNNYVSLWPDKCSVDFLVKKRRLLGTIIFNTQYQNDIEAMKGEIFKIDWFKYYQPEEVRLSELQIYQGIDLAIKQSETADKFAIVTIGIDVRTKKIYILDYYNSVTHYSNQKKMVKEKYEKFKPIKIAVEANGYQRAFLQDIIVEDALARIPVVPRFTEKDKVSRAWKLSAYFERGQVFFQPWMTELVEQLLKFPHGRYKDLFDAIDNAISCALDGVKKQRSNEPGLL